MTCNKNPMLFLLLSSR